MAGSSQRWGVALVAIMLLASCGGSSSGSKARYDAQANKAGQENLVNAKKNAAPYIKSSEQNKNLSADAYLRKLDAVAKREPGQELRLHILISQSGGSGAKSELGWFKDMLYKTLGSKHRDLKVRFQDVPGPQGKDWYEFVMKDASRRGRTDVVGWIHLQEVDNDCPPPSSPRSMNHKLTTTSSFSSAYVKEEKQYNAVYCTAHWRTDVDDWLGKLKTLINDEVLQRVPAIEVADELTPGVYFDTFVEVNGKPIYKSGSSFGSGWD